MKFQLRIPILYLLMKIFVLRCLSNCPGRSFLVYFILNRVSIVLLVYGWCQGTFILIELLEPSLIRIFLLFYIRLICQKWCLKLAVYSYLLWLQCLYYGWFNFNMLWHFKIVVNHISQSRLPKFQFIQVNAWIQSTFNFNYLLCSFYIFYYLNYRNLFSFYVRSFNLLFTFFYFYFVNHLLVRKIFFRWIVYIFSELKIP
jgi:hypothetical protein